MIYFWQLHGDAVIGMVLLFAAYAVLLTVALRVQRRIHDRQIDRVRGQRDRARARNRKLRAEQLPDEPIPYTPVWTTGAPREAINAEFDALMAAAFVDDGGEG